MVPYSNYNVIDNITSLTSELLCSYIIEPPKNATITTKEDSGASNNYWRTEDQLVLTDKNDTSNRSTIQLPNNASISSKHTVNIPFTNSLGLQATKAPIFDGLHSASLVSLVQLFDDYCIAILDKNEVNILKE